MVRDFQSRLALKQEIMKRKILDNQIELAGNPTDCIRITCTRNDEGDITNRVISKATVDSIIWPPLKELPIRKIHKNKDTTGQGKVSYQITSLVGMAEEGQNESMFKLYFPHNADLNVDDMIVRVFIDPDVEDPIILVVKIVEVLGTFGQMMLLSESANCALDTEDIPEKLANVIGEMAERRLHIKF